MRKSDQRIKAYELLQNRLQYAIDHSSEYHFRYANDFITEMNLLEIFTDAEAERQYKRVEVYWQEWEDSHGHQN